MLTDLRVSRMVYEAILMGCWHSERGWIGYWGAPYARRIPYVLQKWGSNPLI